MTEYLQKKGTNRVFVSTATLAKRGDMVKITAERAKELNADRAAGKKYREPYTRKAGGPAMAGAPEETLEGAPKPVAEGFLAANKAIMEKAMSAQAPPAPAPAPPVPPVPPVPPAPDPEPEKPKKAVKQPGSLFNK